MAPRPRCPTCGSKQWHKEPSSGLIACSEGHVLQNYRNETTEVEEMGPHAVKKRALKTKKKRKGTMSQADPKLYHGARGRYQYFLCLQLIFRKQIAVLTRMWELPPEFEVICRDLWALHLNLLPDPPPDEPYLFAQEQRGSDVEEAPQGIPTPTPEAESQRGERTDEDADEREDEVDSEMEQLMRENSEISSSSEEEDGGGGKTPATKKKKKKGRYAYEGPASTIAVLVVAFWTLRIPVLYRDLTRMIESYELPYLDGVRVLPASMVCHLTKHDVQALSPPHAPTTHGVHGIASRLGKLLYSSYGIYTPEVNAAPILWRVVRAIGGTPVLYGLTKRLSQVLSLPLRLHSSLAPGLYRVKSGDPRRHEYDNVAPEVGMMAACIVVLKMAYGLDGKARVPRTADDPVCALPRIDEYLRVVREMKEGEGKRREAVFSSRNAMAVGDIGSEEVDEYLDFCEKALLGGELEDSVLGSYFPVGGGEKQMEVSREAEDQVRRRLAATVAVEEGGELNPGEEYTIWHWRDVLGTCAEDYELVLGRGGTWAGVEREYLGGVVEMYERRVVRWWEVQKRRMRDEVESRESIDR